MAYDLPFHALLLLGVLWLCAILRWVWPRRERLILEGAT
jgi:hypothetical protein